MFTLSSWEEGEGTCLRYGNTLKWKTWERDYLKIKRLGSDIKIPQCCHQWMNEGMAICCSGSVSQTTNAWEDQAIRWAATPRPTMLL